ncbi:hypothetical protein A7U60_g2215 [Sanghuangporus baumii]|uniref:DUF6699 domain-containing protein n=1 Tax=Sanghuangporus baumii TaxID=108892 RepID=A0A9Q5I2K2_SANBA|nr:hypothetical protein A7U60_g2215 [Sanghuangporus baumii]
MPTPATYAFPYNQRTPWDADLRPRAPRSRHQRAARSPAHRHQRTPWDADLRPDRYPWNPADRRHARLGRVPPSPVPSESESSGPSECSDCPSPFIPPRPSSSSGSPSPFIPPRPSPSPEPVRHSYTDEQAFDRWLRRHPGTYPPQDGRYSPYRAGNDLPVEPPVIPPRPKRRRSQSTPHSTPGGFWPHVDGLPERAPDNITWCNVQGGNLHWTPHPWVPHPFSHPNTSGAKQPYHGTDPETAETVTGGHPLPGMDPFWSPTRWVPPHSPPSYGISLDAFMVPNPRSWYAPQLLWDAAVQPPYCMQRVTSRGNIVDFGNTDFFKRTATVPGVKSLLVSLPYMRNSWGPAIIKQNTPITIGDVFKKVWDYLHTQIKAEDWKALEKTYGEDWAKRVWDAFDLRCRTSGALYDWTKSQGMRRVDFMAGNTVYWGTYMPRNIDGTWFLFMNFVPRCRPANY